MSHLISAAFRLIDKLIYGNARCVGCSRAMRDDVSAHRRVVKRLINCPVVTIAV